MQHFLFMRRQMAFPVRFVAAGESVQTTSRELDEDGVYVRCVEPPDDGERVTLQLYLPGVLSPAPIEARVTDRTDTGFFAEFSEVPEAARDQITRALESGAGGELVGGARRAHAGGNRRLLPRYLDRFRVTLQHGAHRAQRITLNLSASGVFIETATPPALDEIVQVILELPDGKPPAEVQGLVLHRVLPGETEPAGAGVQFIGADDAFRARLDAYLERLSKG